MQRISTLLQRLAELAEHDKERTLIDIDLMLDYTRVVYADLLEIRKNIAINTISAPTPETTNTYTQSATPSVEVRVEPTPARQEPVIEHPVEEERVAEQHTEIPHEVKYAGVPNIDVRTHIGINDKYLYISELFKDDRAAYDNAIKQLNTFNTLDTATHWVDSELSNKYNWDKESETVHSFYALLSNSFPAT